MHLALACFAALLAVPADASPQAGTLPGSLAGRVVDDENGLGVASAQIAVFAPVDTVDGVEFRTGAVADAVGAFQIPDLPPGDYYLKAEHVHYRPEFHEDVAPADFFADPTRGRKVRIAAGVATVGVEIRLARMARIEGSIVDDATGQPLSRCDISLWRAGEPRAMIGRENFCTGGAFSVGGLEPGEYYLGARSDQDGYAPSLLGVGPCNFSVDRNLCPLAQATKITLAEGEVRTGVELRMVAGATISAMVVAAPNAVQAPLLVQLVDAQDRPVASRQSSFAAPVDFGNLAPGDYWLAALGAPRNGNHLYPDGACSRWYCDPRLGQKLTVASGQRLETLPIVVDRATPYERCQANATTLCLDQGRYQVEAFWQDYLGQQGTAKGRRLTDDSAYFTFFSAENIELVVKVLNGCDRDLGHRFWVFAGGLTNVGVRLRITDTLTGEVYERTNALGTTYPPLLDTAAFATCDAPEPAADPAQSEASAVAQPATAQEPTLEVAETGACSTSSHQICLGGRFQVRPTYSFGGEDGFITPAVHISADAGYAYFFDPDNVEILFKILDACERDGHFWVFATGLTDVKSYLRIEDTHTGQVATYGGFAGPFQPIIDTTTFTCN